MDSIEQCLRCDNKVQGKGYLCDACIADDYDDFEDTPALDEDEEFLEFECGMTADGTCMLAGTEDCDWECPRTRLRVRALIQEPKP